jgi:hypothetical protein
MKYKVLALSGLLLGFAALSPAPINSPIAKAAESHHLHNHTEAELQDEQKYNGTQSVVGSVPQKTNDNGYAQAPVANDAEAAKNIADHQVLLSDPKAVSALKRASAEVKREQEGSGGFSIFGALLVFALGFGVFQGFRMVMEKVGPAPKRLK